MWPPSGPSGPQLWLIDWWVCSDLAQARISFATFLPRKSNKIFQLWAGTSTAVWRLNECVLWIYWGAIKKEEFSTKRRTTGSFRMQRSFLANLCEFALYIHNGHTHTISSIICGLICHFYGKRLTMCDCVWLVRKMDVNSGAVNDSKSKQKINISLIDFCEHLIGLLGSGSDLPVSVWFMVVSTAKN